MPKTKPKQAFYPCPDATVEPEFAEEVSRRLFKPSEHDLVEDRTLVARIKATIHGFFARRSS